MKRHKLHYTLMHELMASPTEPMPLAARRHQLTFMWQGLAAIEKDPTPSLHDWDVCSNAVNLMETLVAQGVVEDSNGLVADGIAALAKAGRRHLAGGNIRLDSEGITAIRAVLEDYAMVLDTVPARTMVRCHRATEKRLQDILAGKRLPHDVDVVRM